MKVWVTKYALTTGIHTAEAEIANDRGTMIVIRGGTRDEKNRVLPYDTYYHGKEWWTTEKEAVAQAEAMRKRRLASLKDRIKKLKDKVIEITEIGF